MAIAMGGARNAFADGGFSKNESVSRYFMPMRPMVAKMNAADKKKALDMEIAIMKMCREYEGHVDSKGDLSSTNKARYWPRLV